MLRSKGMPLGILFVLFVGALLWMPNQTMLGAQQSKETQNKKEEATPKKSKGRLPVFYSQVVSGDQRDEIYAIQAKYAPEMDALVDQLVALRNKQREEIKAVLTPKQIARVKQLREEAQQLRVQRAAKRAAAKAERDTAESGNSE